MIGISSLFPIYFSILIFRFFQDELRRENVRASSALRGFSAADAQRKHSHRRDDEDIILVRFTEGKGKRSKKEKEFQRRADSKGSPLPIRDSFLPLHSDSREWALVRDRWDFGIISFRRRKRRTEAMETNFIKQIRLKGCPSWIFHAFQPLRSLSHVSLLVQKITSNFIVSCTFLVFRATNKEVIIETNI